MITVWTDNTVANPTCLTENMLDEPLNLQAYITLSLVLHLSHSGGLGARSRDLLGEGEKEREGQRERANKSSLAPSSPGCTDTEVITLPVPELRRSSQGGPNKQTSLALLFIEVGASPKQLNLSP